MQDVTENTQRKVGLTCTGLRMKTDLRKPALLVGVLIPWKHSFPTLFIRPSTLNVNTEQMATSN